MFSFMCMCICLHESMYTMQAQVPVEARNGLDPEEPELQVVVSHLMQMLGTKSWSSIIRI